MANHHRRKSILRILYDQGEATNQELMHQLGASLPTIRRELAWLSERNMIARTRGGARRVVEARTPSLTSTSFLENCLLNVRYKQAIARAAADMCRDGESIIINGGSTTFLMGEYLLARNLQVLTNSVSMARRLRDSATLDVYFPGGTAHRQQGIALDPSDNDVIVYHRASRMFMSAYGISSMGILEDDPLLLRAEINLLRHADELIVLADSSKFERSSQAVLCGIDRVSTIITEAGALYPDTPGWRAWCPLLAAYTPR